MATNQTRMMVTEWGMSDKLGMIAYGDNSQEVFLGHRVTQSKNVSEATARQIDSEIRRIIDEAYAQGEAAPDREHRRAAPAGQGAAGARDAVGRRDPADHARRADRAEPAGRAGAAGPRQRPDQRPRAASDPGRAEPGPAPAT